MGNPKKYIEKTENYSGHVYMPADSELQDMDRGWQFRIAIKPTQNNLNKAANALAPLFCAHGLEFKCLVLNHADAITTEQIAWDGSRATLGQDSDRDQRGKEVCVYMRYDGSQQRYEKAPDEWKDIMLSAWKELQLAGVAVGYVAAPFGDREVPSENGLPTPFSYTADKPWQGRHGILHQGDYNPHQYQDPLKGVLITRNDCLDYGINLQSAVAIQKARLDEHGSHMGDSLEHLKAALTLIKESPAEQRLDHVMQQLQALTLDNHLTQQQVMSNIVENKALVDQLIALYPRTADKSLGVAPFLAELKHYWDKFIKTNNDELILEIITRVGQLRDASEEFIKGNQEIETINREWQEAIATSQSLTGVLEIDETVVRAQPANMQELYRQLVHFTHEESTYSYLADKQMGPFEKSANPLLQKLGDNKTLSTDALVEYHVFDKLDFLEEAYQAIISNKPKLYNQSYSKGWFESRNLEYTDKQLTDIAILKKAYVTSIEEMSGKAYPSRFNVSLHHRVDASPLIDFNRTRYESLAEGPTGTRKKVTKLMEELDSAADENRSVASFQSHRSM